MGRGHRRGTAAISLATRIRISRQGKIDAGAVSPRPEGILSGPKGGEATPRERTEGERGERAPLDIHAKCNRGPFRVGEAHDAERGAVPGNRELLIPRADVGSNPPPLLPQDARPSRLPSPLRTAASKARPSDQLHRIPTFLFS